MAIYRLWLLSLNDNSIIYSRYFPHIEKKDGFSFPWITPQEFMKCLYVSLGLEINENSLKNKLESNLNIFPSDDESSSLKYLKDQSSSSSSCSLNSLISLVSNSTMNTSNISKQNLLDSSETNIMKEHICLYNHLPLIICPIVNIREYKHSSDETKKAGIDNLIMLVYEQNRYLFVCCPRLMKKNGEITTKYNDCFENEKLIVEEHSISLSYTILHMIASMFFLKNKSIVEIERFISTFMPFGNLIKTNSSDIHYFPLTNLNFKTTTISLRLTESISTSFRTCPQNDNCNEVIFGTLTVDYFNSEPQNTKKEIIINIDNLDTVLLMLPNNCHTNNLALVYDVANSSNFNLNVVHYKSHNQIEEKKSYFEEPPLTDAGFKIFRTKYVIYKKGDQVLPQNKSFIDSQNIFHISLRIILNDKIPFEEVRFKYFMVKFSLDSGLVKNKVQTIGNSINNLIIRESVKISQGQVKSENNMLVWMIGTRLMKSKKLSFDIDLIIPKDNLSNLQTHCNFSHFFLLKNIFNHVKNTKTSLLTNSNEERYRLKESRINYPLEMLMPFLKLSRINLLLEPSKTQNKNQMDSSIGKSMMSNEVLQIEYHLNSFEYRLFPKILENVQK